MGFNNLEKKEGKNPILSYLADSEADIICLQEYNSTKNKKYLTDEDIRKALKAYPYRSIHNPEKGGSQLACFSNSHTFGTSHQSMKAPTTVRCSTPSKLTRTLSPS